jgi:hypothetical protein
MKIRDLLSCVLALGAPAAIACSVSTPWYLYINVVRLDGPAVEGLKWFRIYNILDYEGTGRVLVSAVRQGRRIPVAKWEDGRECWFEAGRERCAPNEPRAGVNLESHFPDWTDASDRKQALKKLDLPLVVEIDGREVRMALRSRPVRNNRKLQDERVSRAVTNDACWRMND